LPDNTEAVIVLNVRQISESPVFKKYFREQWENAARNNPEDRPFFNMMDADSIKEIVRITLALPPGPFDKKALVIVQGRFDLAKLKAVAEALARTTPITVKIRPAGKIPLYEIQLDDPPNPFLFAAFPDKETVVASPSRDAILDVIAKASGKKKMQINPGLLSLVNSAHSTQGIWWAGKIQDAWKTDLGKMPQLKAFAPKMETFGGGIAFTDSIKAGLHVQMQENQAAVDFKQALELSKTLGNVMIMTSPMLKDHAPVLKEILTALQFNHDKGVVGMEVTIPESLIEKGLSKKGTLEESK
jgi:hypothetical protein